MDQEIIDEFELAKKVRENAYDPYTGYSVGAVLVTKSGKKYTGCNISNIGVISICAERVAFVKAISEGEKEFKRIVIVGGKKDGELVETTPCGHCRQFMAEFVDENFEIYTLNNKYKIDELLPGCFKIN